MRIEIARRLRMLSATLVTLVALSAGLVESRAGLLGASRLYTLDRVTVVYPAGPGEPVEDNRLSAERRAAFLRSMHGVEAEVAADDEVDEEALRGHLLLLGWSNRLLGTEPAPRPFERSDGRLEFLGGLVGSPDEDLLIAHASPYEPASEMFFWSRIDLELDRFQVLPLSGSDWGLFRDYLAVNQGMFTDDPSWPPTRNVFAEAGAAGAVIPAPPRKASEHYTLHYPGRLLSDAEAEAILLARERALARAIVALSAPPSGFRVDLYVYADRDAKLEQVGVPDPAHTVGRRREIHMLRSVAGSANPHEDVHALAHALLGPSYLTALYEGLAIVAEQPPENGELPVFGALLLDRKAFPKIDDLLDEERLRVLSKQGIGFPAAGLLVAWLESVGGTDLVERIYGMKSVTAADIGGLLGKSAKKTDAAFEAWTRRLAKGSREELAHRTAMAEAALKQSQGSHEEAVVSLERALEIKPDDPRTLYELAEARTKAGRDEDAAAALLRLIEVSSGAGESPYLAFAHYQLGRVYERLGRRDNAAAEFRRVLELPDRDGLHEKARDQMVGPTSPDE